VRWLTGILTAAVVASTSLLPGAAALSTAAPHARPAPAENALRVGTYNICKRTCGRGRFAWGHRRLALGEAVRAAHPDVLAVQEATTQHWHGGWQIDDVRRILHAAGYEIASTNFNGCTRGCSRGAHIFYDPTKLHVAQLPAAEIPAAGMKGMSTIAGDDFGGIQDRDVSWAFLSPNGSTRTALYMSVHLPTQKSGTGERLRVAVARKLRPWAESLIQRSGLPQADPHPQVDIVIAGDLNSFQRRQPHGAQSILSDAGLIDGAEAPERVNASFGTVNYTPKTRRFGGFPPQPYRYGSGSTPARIDYVFSNLSPLRHEVVLELTSSGAFDNDLRASDHNMVLVDLPLR
jgi:endonuclease/exonuclease/phosphatase family metal-dependent hydrolase